MLSEVWGTALNVTVSRLSMIAVLAAGLALAGCGRKGALEPPPSASVASVPPGSGPSLGEPEHGALEGERRQLEAPQPFQKKKSFILDFLIASERPPSERPSQPEPTR
jgi:predicted small lipoprotein YifL